MGQFVEVLDPHDIFPKSIYCNVVRHVQTEFYVIPTGQLPHLNGFIEIND